MVKRKTAPVIIENLKGKVLLILRDNKPSIPYPNYWTVLGGFVEKGETPKQAVAREAKEELDYTIINFKFFKKYFSEDKKRNLKKEHNVFYSVGDYKLSDFKLQEGQEIRFLSKTEIQKLKMTPIGREIILDYFENHPKN